MRILEIGTIQHQVNVVPVRTQHINSLLRLHKADVSLSENEKSARKEQGVRILPHKQLNRWVPACISRSAHVAPDSGSVHHKSFQPDGTERMIRRKFYNAKDNSAMICYQLKGVICFVHVQSAEENKH